MSSIALAVPATTTDRRRGFAILVGVLYLGIALSGGLVFNQAVLDWMAREYGEAARERVIALQHLVEKYAGDDEGVKLDQVNRFFNAVHYDSDFAQWAEKDYWATPYEVLGVNSADCEDYAISKYFTLISMGVDEERLRITYVKAIDLNQAHMVLAYYQKPDAEPLILDNLTSDIERASRRKDLVPVYSFNGADLWLAVNRVEGKKAGTADRLSRWQDYQRKLMQQMSVGQ